jgi:hypothetical protein
LQDVLKEYPGLAKTFNAQNTQLTFASPERIAAQTESMKKQGYTGGPGHLEFFPKGESESPDPSKNILEVYDKNLINNPTALKNAVYGDLMHGLHDDPTWKKLRTEFKNAFTPDEIKKIKSKQSWWGDASNGNPSSTPTLDAYIRGWLNERDVAIEGQKKSGNRMYSKKQLFLLNKMEKYLKTGELK